MRQLTAETRIRVRASLPLPRKRELTGETRIRLSQIKDLKDWALEMAQDEAAPEGTVHHWSDGDHIKKNGKWVPVAEAKKNPTVRGEKSRPLTEAEKRNVDTTYHNEEIDNIIKDVNPKIENGGFGYQNNCTRCCVTYEMLRRGKTNITAMPTGATNDKEIENDFLADYIDNGFACMYKDPDIKETTGTGKDDILKDMAEWGDGARCSIVVITKSGNCHNFMAEQINGKTIFVNPQDSTRSYYTDAFFNEVVQNTTKYFRTDKLDTNEVAAICYEEKK